MPSSIAAMVTRRPWLPWTEVELYQQVAVGSDLIGERDRNLLASLNRVDRDRGQPKGAPRDKGLL